MRLKQLAITLQRLGGFPAAKAALEQYATPAELAARLLFHARMRGDIGGKTVCDLGSGTGILAIGAALLGASRVIGIEVDRSAVRAAEANAASLNAQVEFITADIRSLKETDLPALPDTVIMNPPFGAQKEHADRPFIDTALLIAPVMYGIFNAGSRQFLETYTRGRAELAEVVGGVFPIRRTFGFHTRDLQEVEVEIIRLIRKNAASAGKK